MKTAVVSGLALVLAGCSSGAAQPPVSAPTKAAATSNSAPPSVAPPKLPERLLPTEDEVEKLGLTVSTEPVEYVVGATTPLRLVNACGVAQPWDAQVKQGAHASAKGSAGQLEQLMAQYDGITGTAVVEGVKKALACGTVPDDDLQFTVLGEFAVPKVADDQYGFCLSLEGTGRFVHCVLLLANGDRAEALTMANQNSSDARAQQAVLKKVAPVFAEALGRP
ncbi:hypothetical protein VSH64_12745 [Amycolatopsis rhabdoformis]|uniref:Sensor domain-containing protein n=1 Tax=Amycolatopsis rhabdoformis TaxID=1448059 RepID=A0ABZ1IH24_9PSEU|nr:hypothetical protein [Amycolatopsis rhabdoformis]WSE32973.1 hypothetical protein VSH64_12745 [Amycolatopsis rhabdoformis]